MEASLEKTYYRELDKNKRKVILEGMAAEDLTAPEYELRSKLWELRYADRQREPRGVDYYIRGWMNLIFLLRNQRGLFGKKRAERDLQQVKNDWNIALLEQEGELGKVLLYQEFYNMIRLYMHLCMTDKSYGTTAFGLVHMDNDKLISKLGMDIKSIAFHLPSSYGMKEGFSILSQAARDAFCEEYPDFSDILDRDV